MCCRRRPLLCFAPCFVLSCVLCFVRCFVQYGLRTDSRWRSLGYAAASWPVLGLMFYVGVRFVSHEKR